MAQGVDFMVDREKDALLRSLRDRRRDIDAEEKELIESIGEVDPESLQKPSDDLNRQLRTAAREYAKKHETKMNIRIDPEELAQTKKRAAREGLTYQTLVKSVLHKYVTGQLVDAKN